LLRFLDFLVAFSVVTFGHLNFLSGTVAALGGGELSEKSPGILGQVERVIDMPAKLETRQCHGVLQAA